MRKMGEIVRREIESIVSVVAEIVQSITIKTSRGTTLEEFPRLLQGTLVISPSYLHIFIFSLISLNSIDLATYYISLYKYSQDGGRQALLFVPALCRCRRKQ
jgi:hypothetical protein